MTQTWKEFGLKAAAGVALFALANLVVYRVSGFFERERHYREAVGQVANRDDVAVILMGDSHVAKIPNDYLLPQVRNVAAGGDSYRECYAKLRYLLQRVPGINTVVLTADYHMFGAGRVESSNRSFVEGYLLASNSAVGYEKGRLSAAFNLVPLFNDDFVQYLKKDMRVKLQPALRTADAGHVSWQALDPQNRERRAVATGQGDHAGIGAAADPLIWYERTLALARRHHVQVIAVRFPAAAAYLAQIPTAGKALIDRQLERMEVGPVVELGEALQDPALFEDEDHVNPQGAAILLCLLESRTGLKLVADAGARSCPAPARAFAANPTLPR